MADLQLPASLADEDVYARKAEAKRHAEADKAAAELTKHTPKHEADAQEIGTTAIESAAAGLLSIPGTIAGLGATGLEAAGVISPETGQAARDASSGRAMVSSLVGAAHQIAGGNTEEALAAGEQARDEYAERARTRAEFNPGTAFAGEVLGQVGSLYVTGGLGGAGGKAGAATTKALGGGALARMAGSGVSTAIEGATIGTAAQMDEAWLKDQRVTGQQLLASVGFNGLLGGVLGFGGKALTEGLGAARGAAAEAIEGFAGKARGAAGGTDAAIAKTFAATTGEAAEETMPKFYREILEGEAPAARVTNKATEDLYQHATQVEENLGRVTEEVSQRNLKLANVAKNFEAAPPPAGAVLKAREAALGTWAEVKALEERVAAEAPRAAVDLGKLRNELALGVKEIASTQSPAEAYIAADQMRRQVYARLEAVGRSAVQTSDPLMSRILPEIREKLRTTYQGAADHLFDASVWGKQGASQRAVNDAWVEFINARKNVFRGFADQTGETLAPNGMKIPQYDMRQTSLAKLVSDMSGPSARDASRRWNQYIASTEKLTNAIGEGYELSGAKSEALDQLNQGVAGVRKTITGASRDLRAVSQAEQLLGTGRETHVEQHIGAIAGGAAGAGMGGLVGGPAGAAAGAWVGKTAGKALGAASSPANLLEHRVQLQVVADRVKRNVSSALDAYFGGMDRVAEAVGGAAKTVGRAASSAGSMAKASALPTAMASLQGKARTPEDGYRKRAEKLIDMTADNGAGVRDAAAKALGPVAAHDPHVAMALVTSATNAANYLKNMLPTPLVNTGSLTPNASKLTPSRVDLHEFAQVAQALDHPVEVLARDLSRGTVSQPVIQAIKAVYPDMYDSIREETMQRIAERDSAGNPIPLRQVAVLDTMLDLNGAGSPVLAPDFALHHGPKISGKFEEQRATPPKAGRQNAATRINPPSANFLGS